MIFEAGQHVLFIGDSITDCGRRDSAPPYGSGYMSLVHAHVTAARPDLGLTWTNRGGSGDTTRHLAKRWTADVEDMRPDWLSVMIGINDVWRHFDDYDPDGEVPVDEYASTLRGLLRRAVGATGCRLVLADPYVIEPNGAEPQRAMSGRYAAVVADLAAEFGAVHVATQAAFDRVLTMSAPADWSHDRIHPNLAGHAVIAQAFLSAIGWRLPA